MIDADRFIINTLPNWIFGPDNTGNIMDQRNIRSVWEQCKKGEFSCEISVNFLVNF